VGPTAEGIIPDQSFEILERLGEWYLLVEESYVNVDPAPQLLSSKDVFITSRDKTLYIHFNKGLPGNGFKLKPLDVLPLRATLLNNNKSVEFVVDLSPSDHAGQKKYLRLRNLPVNEMANSVMIIKLEFKNVLT